MQENDVIQKSTSLWALPIVLVKKKDSSTRFCVDYRRFNEVTRIDAFPPVELTPHWTHLQAHNGSVP